MNFLLSVEPFDELHACNAKEITNPSQKQRQAADGHSPPLAACVLIYVSIFNFI